MTSKEIRQSFLDYFEKKGHKIVPSAPMVIKDDPTLMFTNAGMNPWKGIILGNDPIQYPRVADSVYKWLIINGVRTFCKNPPFEALRVTQNQKTPI